MLIGEYGVAVPTPDPRVRLAESGRHAWLLGVMCHDVLWDIFLVHTRSERSRMDEHMLDLIRAELARRHHPLELEPVCTRCLRPDHEHDEVFMTCPDPE